MNNEIKEILEEMKIICDVWVKVDGNMKTYNQDQIHCIYDYITDLQEENEKLKEKIETIKSSLDKDLLDVKTTQDVVDIKAKYIGKNGCIGAYECIRRWR